MEGPATLHAEELLPMAREDIPAERSARTEADRLLAIRRAWLRSGRTTMRFSWRAGGDRFSTLFLAQSGLFTVLVNHIDTSLRGLQGSPFTWTLTFPVNGLGLSLVAAPCYFLNSWLLHRLLARKTPEDFTVRPALLVLRWIAIGLPLLGLSVIPIWQWVLQAKPPWAFSRKEPRLELSDTTRAAQRAVNFLERLEPRWTVVLMVFLQGLPLILLIDWIQSATRAPHRIWPLGIAISASCHLIVIASSWLFCWYLRVDERSSVWRTALLFFISLFFLFPGPYWTSTALIAFVLASPTNRDGSLSQELVEQRRSTRWLDLEERIDRSRSARSWWSRWRRSKQQVRAEEDGAAGKPLHLTRRLLWLKTAFLVLDGAAISFMIEILAKHLPQVALLADGCLAMLVLVSAGSLGAGILFLAARTLCRLIRPAEPPPYSRVDLISLVTRAAALFFYGCMIGRLLRDGRAHLIKPLVTNLLIVFSLWLTLLFAFRVIRLTVRVGAGERQHGTKPYTGMMKQMASLFTTAAVTGVVTALLGVGLIRELSVFWLWVSPGIGFLLACTLLPWLLRPFRYHQMFSCNLSQAQRLAIAMMTCTTLLPLGGLATPFWVLARRRLWPESSEPLR